MIAPATPAVLEEVAKHVDVPLSMVEYDTSAFNGHKKAQQLRALAEALRWKNWPEEKPEDGEDIEIVDEKGIRWLGWFDAEREAFIDGQRGWRIGPKRWRRLLPGPERQ